MTMRHCIDAYENNQAIRNIRPVAASEYERFVTDITPRLRPAATLTRAGAWKKIIFMPEDSDQARASSSPTDPAAGAPAPPDAAPSREVLKSAYNAFKKRWKLTRLDYESRIGRGPLSPGQKSSIVGITAPKEFPRAVWEELVKQGRLKHAGSGLYAMP
jgi:hypothetical protein